MAGRDRVFGKVDFTPLAPLYEETASNNNCTTPRDHDFGPNRNRVESNRITDIGGEDGVAIDVRGRTHDLRVTGNAIRETRGPSRRVGLRIAPGAPAITVTDNRSEGLASDVSDLRAVSG